MIRTRTQNKQSTYGKKGGEAYIDDVLVLKQLRDYYKGKSSDTRRKN